MVGAGLLDQDATAGRLMIIAHRSDGFQRHVSGALNCPLIVLFEQQGTDETDDGVVIWE